MKAFLEESSAMVKDNIGISLYEIKDGKIGVSSIAEGPKGEGGLEDATGAGSVGGAGYTQTSPVVNLSTFQFQQQAQDSNLFDIRNCNLCSSG